MQTDAEHQEDDADFGEFRSKVLVGDKAGRIRPDQNTGDEITHQRRQAETMRDGAEDECQHETPDQG